MDLKTLDATPAQAWCLVWIDARPCAVALHAVAEIVEAEELVPLALCSPRVLGLCTYRRDILPVIALSEGTPAPRPAGRGLDGGRPVIMILRGEHGTWGIKIDRGGAVVAEGPLDDRGAPTDGPGGAFVLGSITRGEATHAVIDAEATWRDARDAIERWSKGAHGRDTGHEPWQYRNPIGINELLSVKTLPTNPPSRGPR